MEISLISCEQPRVHYSSGICKAYASQVDGFQLIWTHIKWNWIVSPSRDLKKNVISTTLDLLSHQFSLRSFLGPDTAIQIGVQLIKYLRFGTMPRRHLNEATGTRSIKSAVESQKSVPNNHIGSPRNKSSVVWENLGCKHTWFKSHAGQTL